MKKVEQKIKELLEATRTSLNEGGEENIIMQGNSQTKDPNERPSGPAERGGEVASASAKETGLPISNMGGEHNLIMQGNSKTREEGEEDLEDESGEEAINGDSEDRHPGRAAAKAQGEAPRPGGGANAGGEEQIIRQGSSSQPFTNEEKEELKKVFAEAGIPAEAQDELVEGFEAAVAARVEAELDASQDALVEAVAELGQMNAAKLYEDVNSYLNYVAEQWLEQNELAIESGIRAEIAEEFITALRDVFAEHYIEVPEERVDLLATLQDKVEELEGKLNESVAQTIKLTEEKTALERHEIVERLSRDLVVTDQEKFAKLVEEVDFEDAKTYEEAIVTLRGRYFPKTASSGKPLTEAVNEDLGSPTTGNRMVDATVRTLARK